MSVELWWRDGHLYAGCFEELSVAYLYRSNNGYHYGVAFDVPVSITRKWGPCEVMKELAEKRVREFFDLANTSRPAMDHE